MMLTTGGIGEERLGEQRRVEGDWALPENPASP